jgi:hypothetical protein
MLRTPRRLGIALAGLLAALTASVSTASALTVDAVVFSGHTDLFTCASGPVPAVSCPGMPLVGGSGAFDWVSGGAPVPVSCVTDSLATCNMHMAGNWVGVVCGTMEIVGEVDGSFMAAPVNVVMVVVAGIGVFAGSSGTTVAGVVDMTPAGNASGTSCSQGFDLTGVMVVH